MLMASTYYQNVQYIITLLVINPQPPRLSGAFKIQTITTTKFNLFKQYLTKILFHRVATNTTKLTHVQLK